MMPLLPCWHGAAPSTPPPLIPPTLHLILDIGLVELALGRLPKGLWPPQGMVGHRDIISEYLYISILPFQTHTNLIGNKSYERL